MASVAKWLRQWIVVPPFAGSIPVVRPNKVIDRNNYWRQVNTVNSILRFDE